MFLFVCDVFPFHFYYLFTCKAFYDTYRNEKFSSIDADENIENILYTLHAQVMRVVTKTKLELH